jgi:DNA-binding CsgD family transcriptional regulator
MHQPRDPSAAAEQRTTETPGPSPADLKAVIEAERTGLPFVHWRTGAGTQQLRMLGDERERVMIGRRPDSDVALPWDLEVSRSHALLERVGGHWTIIDDGLSRNGTFVNGSRIRGRHLLHDRDRLCFGQTQMIYRRPPDPDEGESTARAPGRATGIPLSETQRRVLIALCRPVNDSTSAMPATNRQIADEVYLSVDAVKAHLRSLFQKFGIESLPQNQKRSRLVAEAFQRGMLTQRDL